MTTPTPPTNPTGVDEAGEYDDFDLWLATQAKGKRVKVLGEIVTLPDDVPLGFSAEMARLEDSENEEDLKRVVGLLYGQGALDKWTEANVGVRAFQVLLAYGAAHLNGEDVTFAEAAEMVRKANAAQTVPGKARAAAKKSKRRKGPGGGSPATGR